MRRVPSLPYVKKDLQVVSWFIVLVLLLIAGIEAQPREAPEWTDSQFKPKDGQGPEGPGPQEPQLTVTEALSSSGYTAEGQASEEAFALEYAVVAEVQVVLEWTDDYGNNDEFQVTLLWEGTEVGSSSGSTGKITLGAVPSEDGELIGNFTVRIEAVRCPGLIGPTPIDRDQGNDWTLKVEVTVSATSEEG